MSGPEREPKPDGLLIKGTEQCELSLEGMQRVLETRISARPFSIQKPLRLHKHMCKHALQCLKIAF